MNFEWLKWTKDQAEYFTNCGHEVIIVDNRSTYIPLLEWYKTCPYKVISTEGVTLNTYNRFVWEMDLHNIHTKENYYAVTDSDLGLEQIPKDFAEKLIGDIERSEGIIKSGLSLEIEDLPDNIYANRYRQAESKNFSNQDSHGFYGIPVDTTFAVYSKERCTNLHKLWRSANCVVPDSFLDNRYFYRSHRSPRPYTAKHLPWYMDINNLTEEQLYHISVAKHGSVLHFKDVFRKELKEQYNMEVL
jgi:hypothetical protein